MRFLVSAGEASGDLYAAGVVKRLLEKTPDITFYGCAGPRLQDLGVQPVIDAADLSVVGLAEVVAHLPRIYGEFRKLVKYARKQRPDAALLTDNPDFNLRLAKQLKRIGVPVFYLVAPQVWAWRQGRVKNIRRVVDDLFCLFPFEEPWFRERGVNATYIGHPLASEARTSVSQDEFFAEFGLPRDKPMVVLLPGSREGEAKRHLPIVLDAVVELKRRIDVSLVLGTPKGFAERGVLTSFRERLEALSIQVIENRAWDSIGHAELALAASGTVTMEAAILGTPMVTYYKVTELSWRAGRWLVKTPFLSMVNLIAGRALVPELIQEEMTPRKLADASYSLLTNEKRRNHMQEELSQIRRSLTLAGDPFERVADAITNRLQGGQEKMK